MKNSLIVIALLLTQHCVDVRHVKPSPREVVGEPPREPSERDHNVVPSSNQDDEKISLCQCDNCVNSNVCYTKSMCYTKVAIVVNKHTLNPSRAEVTRSCLSSNMEETLVALFCNYNLINRHRFVKCCLTAGRNSSRPCNSIERMPISSILKKDDYKMYGRLFTDKKIGRLINSPSFYIFLFIGIVLVVLTIIILIMVLMVQTKFRISLMKIVRVTCCKIKFGAKTDPPSPSLVVSSKGRDSPRLALTDSGECTRCFNEQYCGGGNDQSAGSFESRTLQNCDTSESSGRGYPLLLEAHIADQIKLHNLVDSGKFGKVISGTWNHRAVATKIVMEGDAAMHEAAIYHNYHLRHDNILCFISMDSFSDLGPTQHWLVFDYHPKGSLYDYLRASKVAAEFPRPDSLLPQLGLFLLSIGAGLRYLHGEILGKGVHKPRIAHRDLKTKNILVKNDGQCCIADLGMSIVETLVPGGDSASSSSQTPLVATESQPKRTPPSSNNPSTLIEISALISSNNNVGTRRYMAPEVLERCINDKDPSQSTKTLTFDDFLKSDIYSFGLIVWEVTRCFTLCTTTNNRVYEHLGPYSDQLPAQPSVEKTYEVVVQNLTRPPLCPEWALSPLFQTISDLITNCWHHDPDVRPRIFYIYHKLESIFNGS